MGVMQLLMLFFCWKMKIKKQIFGWSMYDFANTIFSALFVTIYFPLFVVLKGGNAFHVGLVMSVSMLLAGLLVPFLGAVADVTQKKKTMLFLFTVLCCVFTFFTGFVGLGMVLLFGLLANLFYHAGLNVYDSLILNISTKKNIGRISGIGVAVGYLGTILSVAVAFFLGSLYGYESVGGIKMVFVWTALLFFGFSLFTFFLVKHASKVSVRKKHFKEAFTRVIGTIRGVKKYKHVWLFLLASFLYSDSAHTAIIFLYLYARDQLGMSLVQFLPLYATMALSAVFGSMFFGHLSDKQGHKRILNTVLLLWIVVIVGLYLKTTTATFVLTGIFGGALLGGLWTTTRPVLVDLAPRKKIAELFGYQGLAHKFSGVIGPLLFGAVAVAVGFREALLVVIGLFVLGIFVLRFVRVGK